MSDPNTPAPAPNAAPAAAPSNPVPAATAPSAASPQQNQPENKTPVTGRPENVPEQFWDTEKGALKSDDLIAAYTPLAEKVKAEEDRLAAYPKAATEIPFAIPDGALGEGVKVELDENHPLIAPARELLFEEKLPPALLGKLGALVVKQQLAEAKEFETARTAQMQKLGDNAGARIDAVKTFVKKFGGPDADAVSEHIFTAKQYGVFETMMRAFSSQNAQPVVPLPNNSNGKTPPKTERRLGDGWYGDNQQKAS